MGVGNSNRVGGRAVMFDLHRAAGMRARVVGIKFANEIQWPHQKRLIILQYSR
jgi:hypothetical protein